jgi:hypothetical protein
MARKKKSVESVRYAMEYECAGARHDGSIEIKDGDRLYVWTPHGTAWAALNPVSDYRSLALILVGEIGGRLVSINPKAM